MSFVRALVVLLSAGGSVALALGFSACIQLGPSNDESTADAGVPTVQDQCSEVMAAYCGRANVCYEEDVNACYPPALQACCGDDCAKSATSDEKAVRACVMDMAKASCDDIVVAKLPDRCKNVVTHD